MRSWVDHPLQSAPASPRTVVRGWCYHRSGEPVRSVRARVGRRIQTGWYGGARPDVQAMFAPVDPVARDCGFEIALELPPGRARIELEALLEGGWIPFQQFEVRVTPAASGSPRFGGAGLGRGARAGARRRWERMTHGDRDFAVAWARQRGWLNLQLAALHPPRPVVHDTLAAGTLPASTLPKLTIVTPSFQQAAYLPATMRSVLSQTRCRIDYIVQDGGSTDGSAALIAAHAGQLKAWDSRPDGGQADAIVRGFRHLDAGPDDLMMYLNSDDILAPGAARYIAEYFARHPSVDVLYGHRILIDEEDREVGRWFTPRRRCDDLRLHDLIPQETLVWRRRVWDRVGGINPEFHFAMDWDLVLRFEAAGARFARVPCFLGAFRLHRRQKSQAEIETRGIPEMNRLRERSLGRKPTEAEMHVSMRRAQFESALLLALWQRGIRL